MSGNCVRGCELRQTSFGMKRSGATDVRKQDSRAVIDSFKAMELWFAYVLYLAIVPERSGCKRLSLTFARRRRAPSVPESAIKTSLNLCAAPISPSNTVALKDPSMRAKPPYKRPSLILPKIPKFCRL